MTVPIQAPLSCLGMRRILLVDTVFSYDLLRKIRWHVDSRRTHSHEDPSSSPQGRKAIARSTTLGQCVSAGCAAW